VSCIVFIIETIRTTLFVDSIANESVNLYLQQNSTVDKVVTHYNRLVVDSEARITIVSAHDYE